MLKEAQKPSEKALSLIQLVGTQVRAARTGVGFFAPRVSGALWRVDALSRAA